ncbi:hypothetical protein [Sorangium sp. So ce861]|uniref:hypothetical protein n=1 Tax=Sorangium sp. So ce861 TaxID=3133323 RepID=UPI003F6152E9
MIDVKALFTPFRSLARLNLDHLDAQEIERYRRAGTLVVSPARRRPRYFDGRFLAAHDLTREQDYFLDRQADLARATGPGVLHGLMVTRVDDTTVSISPGTGVTPAGQLVVLRRDDDTAGGLAVNLADVTRMMQLDRAFHLDGVPNEPPRRRSGLFVLALRPVEFTANPIAAYPTSVDERRAVDDGEIIEAVAVTLVPYRDDHAELDPLQQRAHAARRIFVERAAGGVPAEALPLAMVHLDRGFVMWIDVDMVRREVGGEHAGAAGFGLAPRGLREAYVLQQEAHLAEAMNERRSRPDGLRFSAAEVFRALPPAGQLPLRAVERAGDLRYTQSFFPPQIPCAMALVPDDEVPALVDEALWLPPIDLMAPPGDLDFTSILVLLPAPRELLGSDRRRLAVELAPAAPGVLIRRQPVDVFRKLLPRLPMTAARGLGTPAVRPPIAAEPDRALEGEDAERNHALDLRWQQALDRAATLGERLWYVRRRTLQGRHLGLVPGSEPPRFADPTREDTVPADFRADESHPVSATTSPPPEE